MAADNNHCACRMHLMHSNWIRMEIGSADMALQYLHMDSVVCLWNAVTALELEVIASFRNYVASGTDWNWCTRCYIHHHCEMILHRRSQTSQFYAQYFVSTNFLRWILFDDVCGVTRRYMPTWKSNVFDMIVSSLFLSKCQNVRKITEIIDEKRKLMEIRQGKNNFKIYVVCVELSPAFSQTENVGQKGRLFPWDDFSYCKMMLDFTWKEKNETYDSDGN